MNILLMTTSMKQPDDRDASKTDVVFYFAQEWAKAGHRVVVIHNEAKFPYILYKLPMSIYKKAFGTRSMSLPSVASRKKLHRQQDGVEILRLPMRKFIPHSSYAEFQYKSQIKKVKAFLNDIDFKPDVITGHWFEPQLRMIHDLGEFYSAKTGFVVHGDFPNNLKNDYKKYISELDCFFLRSESVRRKTLESSAASFMPGKVSVCFSGVPENFISDIVERNDFKKDNIFKMIYVGRLVGYKRIDAVLSALANGFKDKDFSFEIVGTGSEAESLKTQANDLGISDRVTFCGRISREEVQKKLHESDCFVMISENEVFGLVYLEAMTAGCITVASKNGGVDGIINDGYNGFLCEQGNSEELEKLLLKIYNLNDSELREIRNNAYNTIPKYTDSKVALNYLQDIIQN